MTIHTAVHQLSQSDRWNTLSPIEQQQVNKICIIRVFFKFIFSYFFLYLVNNASYAEC